MPRKLTSFIIFLILFCCRLSAQVKVTSEELRILGEKPGIMISVMDSSSSKPLPGATVFVISGTDTLKKVTDSMLGFVDYSPEEFKHESVVLQTSYVGFRTRKDTVKLNLNNWNRVTVSLQEDPMQLNSLIIKGDAVAMVMHGDTTVFNAAAFKTMKGDALRNLLESMPGVKVQGGSVTYKGQRIDRILFNGNNLFGKDMANAMDMVLAREVKSVKVYEKEAVESLDPNLYAAKERVMDVHTWKPLNHVGDLSSLSDAGLYTDEKPEGGHDVLLVEDMTIGSYSTGDKPRINASLNYAENACHTFQTHHPITDMSAMVSVGKDTYGKGGYQVSIGGKTRKDHFESSSVSTFFPSELWTSRVDSSLSMSSGRHRSITMSGSGYTRKGKASLRLNSNFGYSHDGSESMNMTSSMMDATVSSFKMVEKNGSDKFSGAFQPSVSISFAKPRRSLAVLPSLKLTVSEGDGSRLDTLQTSMSREWLTGTLSEKSLNPSLQVVWTEPFGKKASLMVDAGSSYLYSGVTKLYTNVFTGSLDYNNSKDFTQNYLTNSINASFAYGRMNDGLYSKVSLGVKDILDMRNENLGDVKDWSHNYVRPVIGLDIMYSKVQNNFSISYSEMETVPAVDQLRNVVNDSNPLFLFAGSPDLDLSVCRNIRLSAGHSFAKQNIVATLSANASFYSNAIVTRTTYFATETWLDSYSYMAPAGASLVTPENVGGRYNVDVRLGADKYLRKIKTKLNVTMGWWNYATPYYIADVLHRNSNNTFRTDIIMNYRSKTNYIRFWLIPNVGRDNCDGNPLYDFVGMDSSFELKQRILDHFEVNLFACDELKKTTVEELDYHYTTVSLSLAWLFGADRLSSVSVFGNNLLNSNFTSGIGMSDDRISHSNSMSLGRVVGASFKFRIMRR